MIRRTSERVFCNGELVWARSITDGWYRCACGKALKLVDTASPRRTRRSAA